MNKQLYTDSLTGFPNRRSLVKDLIEMSGNEEIILLLINIDDFKEVNDLFGSAIGDLIILHLRTIIDDNNSIKILHRYRLHSDEFAIIISKKEISEFNKFVENLIHQITETFYVGIDEISITASIGISIGRSNHLEKADMALQKAKERKKHAVYFDPSLNTIETYNSNRLMLLNLRKAIKTDNIVPFFQPIYDNAINKITRYESLVRLVDADTVHSPFAFLEISHRSKIYPQITQIMITKTLNKFRTNDYSFSLNISRDDIFNEETVNLIYSKLQNFNSPSRIIFELLETEKIEVCEEVLSFISNVKKLGCKIAVDDFGSGYSNFNYLLSLNVDFIKIDASLIKNIHNDYNSFTITKNIVNFAREMNIKTIAEYVHNEQVFSTIKQLNVDYSQGYYIGKPDIKLIEIPSFSLN